MMTDYPTYPTRSTDYPTGTGESGTTADVAREQGEQLKGTARDAASNIGDTAAAHGRDIADQTRGHVRRMAEDARGTVRGRAQQETQRAGSALSQAGGQLQALADGKIDEAGVFGDYLREAADSVNRWADAVQDRGLDGLLDDLRSYGRRRPGMFLLGAVAAGVLVGRFGRNVAPELRGDDQGQPTLPAPRQTPASDAWQAPTPGVGVDEPAPTTTGSSGATYGAGAVDADIQPPVHPPTERPVQSPADAPARPPYDPEIDRPIDPERERPI
jgi:uncharacterized protein YjbJ (UPF0337 family)